MGAPVKLQRHKSNPLLSPDPARRFRSSAVFNAGALMLRGKIYILYRAQSADLTSTIGLAVTSDGVSIEENLDEPIYAPREEFESRVLGGPGPVGCEDPRLTILDDTIYMLYTAVSDAFDYVRVALTSIRVGEFLERRWSAWTKPILVSPPGVWDKNACLLPKRIQGRYVVIHRFFPSIWVDFVESLDFEGYWVRGYEVMRPRPRSWDSDKVGLAGVPVETSEGWVMIYHARSAYDGAYRLGAALLDREDPTTVLARLPYPLLEPREWYERDGGDIVFSCGHVILDGRLYVYYGASDKYLAVASVDFGELVGELLRYAS
ncbi:MAG: hypothetical protein QXU97_05505 [Fervidicoccaceae archaeon]